jgi:hypothetical protein
MRTKFSRKGDKENEVSTEKGGFILLSQSVDLFSGLFSLGRRGTPTTGETADPRPVYGPRLEIPSFFAGQPGHSSGIQGKG